MLERILRFLRGEEEIKVLPSLMVDRGGHLVTTKVQEAVVLLLIAMAEADGCFTKDELQTVWDELEQHLAVRGEQASELFKLAASSFSERKSAVPAVSLIQRSFDVGQRTLVLALAWRMAKCDGILHEKEEALFERWGRDLKLAAENLAAARTLADTGQV